MATKYVIVYDDEASDYCIYFDELEDALMHILNEFNSVYDDWIKSDCPISSNVDGKLTKELLRNRYLDADEFNEHLWFTIHEPVGENGVYSSGSTWYLYTAQKAERSELI